MKLKNLHTKKIQLICATLFTFSGLGAVAQSPGGVSSNLTLWLKADNAASVTGSPVQSWTTSGGSATGYKVSQATAANRPTLVSGAANNIKYNYNPSIKFNASAFTKLYNTAITPDLLGNNGTAIV